MPLNYLKACTVYASSQEDYDKYKQQLFDSANYEMQKAFITNWKICQSMWVPFEHDQVAHICNTTYN